MFWPYTLMPTFAAIAVPSIAANTQDIPCSFSLALYIFHSSWLEVC